MDWRYLQPGADPSSTLAHRSVLDKMDLKLRQAYLDNMQRQQGPRAYSKNEINAVKDVIEALNMRDQSNGR